MSLVFEGLMLALSIEGIAFWLFWKLSHGGSNDGGT
jgi:hypothetical protein